MTVAALAQMATSSVRVQQDDRLFPSILIAVVSALIGYGIGWIVQPDKTRRFWLIVPFWIVMGFAALDGPASPGATVLAYRGEEVQATVIETRISRPINDENVHYRVAGPDGKRIPGEWTEGHSRRTPGMYRTAADYAKDTWSPQPKDELVPIGTTVRLVVDPGNLVHPHTPKEVGYSLPLGGIDVIILLPALLIALYAGGPLPLGWTPQQLAADDARRERRARRSRP